jgi:hypothetical protein
MNVVRQETEAREKFSAPSIRFDRRRMRRAQIEVPARVRPYQAGGEAIEEIRGTKDICRNGLYFITGHPHYRVNMHVYVACPSSGLQANEPGELARVVRVEPQAGDRWGVAVTFLRSPGFHFCGATPHSTQERKA